MNKLAAGNAITALAQQYKQMVEAADTLREIGSVEQAVQEQERALETTKKVIESARKELRELREEGQKIRESNRKATDELQAELETKRTLAKAEMEEQTGAVKAKAEQVINEANKLADRIKIQARTEAKEITQGASAILLEAEQAKEQLDAAKDELATTEARLKRAQMKLRELLGNES